jgi:MoxR-like ATPase
LLLADEINRATPKTQSAMLEAMAERQVTVLGEKHRITQTTVLDGNLEVESPFTVFATQNPIDQEGTYDLPEAQSDRFCFKVRVDIPGGEVLTRIMHKTAGALAENAPQAPVIGDREAMASEADALAHFDRLCKQIQKIQPMGAVQRHIINMVLAANGRFDELDSVSSRARNKLEEFVKEHLSFGLGPRAATALMLGAKGYSAIELLRDESRNKWPDHGTIEYATDVGLCKVALPVLRHRLKLRFGWSLSRETQSIEDVQDELLREFVINSAPTKQGYAAKVEQDIHEPTG